MNKSIAANIDGRLEQAILGQMLSFGIWDQFDAAGITESDFFDPRNKHIWSAAQAVQEAGGTADIVTVGQRLRADGVLDKVGLPYYSDLNAGRVRPGAANLLLEVVDLQLLATGREAGYAAEILANNLAEPGAVADGAVANHIDALQQILDRRQTRAAQWLDVEAQLSAHTSEVSVTSDQRVFLGLPALDNIIEGVRMGEVCGLMGRPGIGKTIFLSHIARAVTETCGHVLFSLEMPAGQIVGRLKQMLYGLTRWDLERLTRQGQLDDAIYREAFRNLVIVDTPALSVAEMQRRLRQIQKGPLAGIPVRLVTIDHLGLIGGDRVLSTYDRVSTQAREIKELAKRANCGVLLAVQVNREAGGDGSRELGLGSARDSGVVEEAMDYLIGIRRLDRSITLSQFEREKYKDVIFAKVIKNRHGSPDQKEIAYRFLIRGLELREDPTLQPEESDMARLAAPRGGRR